MNENFIKRNVKKVTTLFRNEPMTDINYPELLTAFYHYIVYMHIKKLIKINLNKEKKSSS